MKNYFIFLLIFSFVFIGCGHIDEKAPIEVSTSIDFNEISGDTITILHIVSISDKVKIDKLVLNRGNCKFAEYSNNKRILKYGEEQRFIVKCSNLKEVRVETDKGEWLFNFEGFDMTI